MENEFENLDSPNEDNTDGVETPEETTDNSAEEVDVEKLKEQNKKLFERAKKAEGFIKDSEGNWVKKSKPQEAVEKKEATGAYSELPIADLRALQNVHDEDIERVQKFAKSEGLTIVDAMKNEDLKAILSRREELRKTAEATNTGVSRRSPNNATPDQILAQDPSKVSPADYADAMAKKRLEDAQKRGVQFGQ